MTTRADLELLFNDYPADSIGLLTDVDRHAIIDQLHRCVEPGEHAHHVACFEVETPTVPRHKIYALASLMVTDRRVILLAKSSFFEKAASVVVGEPRANLRLSEFPLSDLGGVYSIRNPISFTLTKNVVLMHRNGKRYKIAGQFGTMSDRTVEAISQALARTGPAGRDLTSVVESLICSGYAGMAGGVEGTPYAEAIPPLVAVLDGEAPVAALAFEDPDLLGPPLNLLTLTPTRLLFQFDMENTGGADPDPLLLKDITGVRVRRRMMSAELLVDHTGYGRLSLSAFDKAAMETFGAAIENELSA